jgi:hypothetical protein
MLRPFATVGVDAPISIVVVTDENISVPGNTISSIGSSKLIMAGMPAGMQKVDGQLPTGAAPGAFAGLRSPLVGWLEIPQIRRRLAFLGRHHLAIGAAIILLVLDADMNLSSELSSMRPVFSSPGSPFTASISGRTSRRLSSTVVAVAIRPRRRLANFVLGRRHGQRFQEAWMSCGAVPTSRNPNQITSRRSQPRGGGCTCVAIVGRATQSCGATSGGGWARLALPTLRAMSEHSSQREHKQHRLVAHLAQFRREDEPALGNLAESRHDGDVLLAAGLECHRRGVEAAPDIDFPQRFEARVVIGDERAIAKAGENQAAGRRQRGAVVRIG